MGLAEMNKQVSAELRHIPKWPGDHQAILRATYHMERMKSLGKKAAGERSAGDVLRGCIELLHRTDPGAQFSFNKEFFEGRAA